MDPRWSQPPPGWQQPYQGWQAPGPSGLLKASRVLLLLGWILAAVGAAFVLLIGVFFLAIFGDLAEDAGAPPMPNFIPGFYLVWGLLSAAGAVCGAVGWRKVAAGDLAGGFVWGLVGSLLPPLNILMLLGAIFAKTCPEAEARTAAAAYGWRPPPQAR